MSDDLIKRSDAIKAVCGKIQIADDVNELNYCCCCGSRNKVRRLKGADDDFCSYGEREGE